MGFTVPPEIVFKLEQKYIDKPVNAVLIKSLLHDFIGLLVQRCIEFQSVTIANFGRFTIYKVFSGRTNKERIRFIFEKSPSLLAIFNKDEYLLQKIPCSATHVFSQENAEKCKNSQLLKKANVKAKFEARANGTKLNNQANSQFTNGILIDTMKLDSLISDNM